LGALQKRRSPWQRLLPSPCSLLCCLADTFRDAALLSARSPIDTFRIHHFDSLKQSEPVTVWLLAPLTRKRLCQCTDFAGSLVPRVLVEFNVPASAVQADELHAGGTLLLRLLIEIMPRPTPHG